MAVAWDQEAPEELPRINANLDQLLRQLVLEASLRKAPTVAMAQDWHRSIFAGVALPVSYYAGEIRDSDSQFPELFGYEVAVGTHEGVPSALVPLRLSSFEASLQAMARLFDRSLPVGSQPARLGWLRPVLQLAAHAHGEWARIHPFANGNGRTARLWANWILLRYGLPPVVNLRPRPSGVGYGQAAERSMAGDHQPMAKVFEMMLRQFLQKFG